MKYWLEVPQNAELCVLTSLKRGARYPAQDAGIACDEHGRLFRFYLGTWESFTNEFNSLHLSGGSWIVHEEEV
jgi:hypothetical protein